MGKEILKYRGKHVIETILSRLDGETVLIRSNPQILKAWLL